MQNGLNFTVKNKYSLTVKLIVCTSGGLSLMRFFIPRLSPPIRRLIVSE